MTWSTDNVQKVGSRQRTISSQNAKKSLPAKHKEIFILKLTYYFSLSLCVYSLSSFYPDLELILCLLLGLARKWKIISISRCCPHDMSVMQGRNCFFSVDGNVFSVDYWWHFCFYLQPLVTYKMDKWVAGFQKQRFLFQRGLQLHGNVQDGFVLANTMALICHWIGRMGKSIKQERIIPDRSALLMSYPLAPQPVGRFFSILSGSLQLRIFCDSMVLFPMSLNYYTCKSIFHDC